MVIKATLSLLLVVSIHWAAPAWALFDETKQDLAVLEDELTYALESQPGLRERIVPMLLAPPKHLWVESASDFAASIEATLRNIVKEPAAIIPCVDCDRYRLFVHRDQRLHVYNGELSITELARLRSDPRYRDAQSLAVATETASGTHVRIIALADGAVLFSTLADSSKSLDQAKPYLHFAREYERRRLEESLAYVFINMGAYPEPMFQVEWVEQWGRRNQHISGIGLSLVNPTVALGAVYHYMLPSIRRANIGGGLYYPLDKFVTNDVSSGDALATGLVLQGTIQYAFSSTFGVFAGVTSEGTFSVGFNFYNPLLMPFLL